MIPTILNLDEIDKQIMDLMQEDPEITHTRLAEILNRSQPAIGARIKKLKELGLLTIQVGIDFTVPKVAKDLKLMMVLIETSDVASIFKIAEECPYVINAMKSTAVKNVVVYMACSSLKRIDHIIDTHFRNKPYVQRLEANIIMGIANPLIFPINLVVEEFGKVGEKCIGQGESCAGNLQDEDHPVLSAVKRQRKASINQN